MKKSHLKKSITTLKPTNINYLIVWLLILTTIGTFSDGVSYTNAYRECIAEVGAIGLLLCWLYSNRHTTAININISVTRLWFGALAMLGALSVFWSAHIGFFASKYLMWLGAMGVFKECLTGRRKIAVKVVDIFGNDTMKVAEVTV